MNETRVPTNFNIGLAEKQQEWVVNYFDPKDKRCKQVVFDTLEESCTYIAKRFGEK